jgi:hypothetical protein
LKEGQTINDDEIFQASALGWCIEWVWQLIACVFVVCMIELITIISQVYCGGIDESYYPLLMNFAASGIFSCS